MKQYLLLCLVLIGSLSLAQDNVDKIVTVSREACDCITNIDTSLNKEEKSKEIKSCITSANLAYQLKNTFLKQTEKSVDSLINKNKSTSKTDTLVIDEGDIDIFIIDEDYKKIEKYLYENCENMREVFFSDDSKLKNSISENEEAVEYYNQGLLAFNDQDYEKAISSYKKAVALDKKFAFAWDNLGLSYRYINKFDKAIECYKTSLKIDSKGKLPLLNLAVTFEYLKEYEKAKKAYKKYGKLHKSDPESFYGLGRIFGMEGNYEEGLDNMIQAYILYSDMGSPYKKDAQGNIAFMYQELEKQDNLELFYKLAKKHNLQVNEED